MLTERSPRPSVIPNNCGAVGLRAPASDQETEKSQTINVQSAIPKKRQDLLKWNGWGYKDSQFVADPSQSQIHFTGTRYPIGGLNLPFFVQWVKDTLNVDLSFMNKASDAPSKDKFPNPNVTPEHLESIRNLNISYSTDGMERLIRSHGQTLKEIFALRNLFLQRIPDVVVWPTCHEDVVQIVKLATECNMVVIPYGGGTSVSGAVECPKNEPRTIISLDTSQMNRILWIDSKNLVACCESGIIGQDLERELKSRGFTTGHEPDSYEFSSLGGWVATRASGMKKNIYGNIEDLLVHVRMVTTKGVLQKNCQVPRMSCGPDFNHIILGSEGSLGVVTEVIMKIRPLPKCQRYGSVVFPNFESGVKCMREVALHRCQPASIRLMDNEQFRFGLALKETSSWVGSIMDAFKKIFITKIKGFDPLNMCVMTLLYEGNEDDVNAQEKKINEIALKLGGLKAGEANGKRGYMLTFVIAYIRDLGLDYHIVAESFETSVPWDRCVSLCKNVKHRIATECQKEDIRHFLISCRVTQTYDAGCVVYFYFGFNYTGKDNPVEMYEHIEDAARDEIIASGGSISHHHGVGKLRKKWYPSTVSDVGVSLYIAAKTELDPYNIFATGNLVESRL